jgi:hypothetical protein
MEVVVLVENANRDESLICWICRGQFGAPFPEEGDNFIVDCCNCGQDQQIASSLTINAARFGALSIQFLANAATTRKASAAHPQLVHD